MNGFVIGSRRILPRRRNALSCSNYQEILSINGSTRKIDIHASYLLCTTGRSGSTLSSWMVRRYDRTRKGNKSPYCKNEYDYKNWMTIRICEGRNTALTKYKQRSKFARYRSIRNYERTSDANTGNTSPDITIRYPISRFSNETM